MPFKHPTLHSNEGFFQHQHFYFLILSNCHELYELYELVKVDIIL